MLKAKLNAGALGKSDIDAALKVQVLGILQALHMIRNAAAAVYVTG